MKTATCKYTIGNTQVACSHPVYAHNLCVFHHFDASGKQEEFANAFDRLLMYINKQRGMHYYFDGFIFPEFNLRSKRFSKDVEFVNCQFPFSLRWVSVHFKEGLSVKKCEFKSSFLLGSVNIATNLNILASTFEHDVEFYQTKVSVKTSFSDNIYKKKLSFKDCTFNDIVLFKKERYSNFECIKSGFLSDTKFLGCSCSSLAILNSCAFYKNLDIEKCYYKNWTLEQVICKSGMNLKNNKITQRFNCDRLAIESFKIDKIQIEKPSKIQNTKVNIFDFNGHIGSILQLEKISLFDLSNAKWTFTNLINKLELVSCDLRALDLTNARIESIKFEDCTWNRSKDNIQQIPTQESAINKYLTTTNIEQKYIAKKKLENIQSIYLNVLSNGTNKELHKDFTFNVLNIQRISGSFKDKIFLNFYYTLTKLGLSNRYILYFIACNFILLPLLLGVISYYVTNDDNLLFSGWVGMVYFLNIELGLEPFDNTLSLLKSTFLELNNIYVIAYKSLVFFNYMLFIVPLFMIMLIRNIVYRKYIPS